MERFSILISKIEKSELRDLNKITAKWMLYLIVLNGLIFSGMLIWEAIKLDLTRSLFSSLLLLLMVYAYLRFAKEVAKL